jgi:hypothetical protein
MRQGTNKRKEQVLISPSHIHVLLLLAGKRKWPGYDRKLNSVAEQHTLLTHTSTPNPLLPTLGKVSRTFLAGLSVEALAALA